MGPVTFHRIVDHIFPIRKSLIEGRFDYPDYGGLPKRISHKLSPEAVDAMQDVLCDIEWDPSIYNTKRKFRAAYYDRLFELGEPVKFNEHK